MWDFEYMGIVHVSVSMRDKETLILLPYPEMISEILLRGVVCSCTMNCKGRVQVWYHFTFLFPVIAGKSSAIKTCKTTWWTCDATVG